MDGQQGGTEMMTEKCKICKCDEDQQYLHLIYLGTSNIYAKICENCKNQIFSDRERSKREDSQSTNAREDFVKHDYLLETPKAF